MVCLLVTNFVFPSQVIAESLSEEEIAGLKEMFKMIDTDNSGQITLEELKNGLERVGSNLKDSEIHGLMQAVSASLKFRFRAICRHVANIHDGSLLSFYLFILS